jgi:hypothetical protein
VTQNRHLILNVAKKKPWEGDRSPPGIEERRAKRTTSMSEWLRQLRRTTAPARVVNRI